jgi:release factor glutamine methyltransferase
VTAVATAPVRDALGGAVDALAAAGVEDPRLDAEVLLAEATGLDRAALVADPGSEVPAPAARRFGEMVRRRLRREPVAYITGRKGFRRIELAIDRRVLVPRPETELLVEIALERQPATVLDIGTGSGAIALAIAEELPGCEVTATDTSAEALEVGKANAERLGLVERIRFFHGTWPEGASGTGAELPTAAEPRFDLIVANLPYIAEPEWPSLPPEVREWEPREALLAGADGLDAIRQLFSAVRCRSSSRIAGGTATPTVSVAPPLALEVGAGQAAAVGEILRGAGFGSIETRRDLAGIERVVIGGASTTSQDDPREASAAGESDR